VLERHTAEYTQCLRKTHNGVHTVCVRKIHNGVHTVCVRKTHSGVSLHSDLSDAGYPASIMTEEFYGNINI